MNKLTKKQKRSLIKIIVGIVLFAAAFVICRLIALPTWAQILVYVAPFAVAGIDVVIKAAKNIAHGQIFDENFLMLIASVGAFVIGEYPEAVFVMLFYRVGELFESIAVGKSRRSVSNLMNICAEYANVERNGVLEEVYPGEVHVGDIIIVKPGEKIPLDGVVLSGASELNTMALTGEPLPREIAEGDSVISGCVNISGLLKVRVTHEYDDCTVSKILELVQNSAANKAKSENFITKFARYYTPAVVLLAALLAIVPSIVLGDAQMWIYRAFNFLVVSCPCALVISVPLSYFGGIAGASRHGILVKGGNYLDALSKVDTVVFDKTGTLTKGSFSVNGIFPENGHSKEELLEAAAFAEAYSDHPIAVSVKAAYGNAIDMSAVTDVQNAAGKGICANVNGKNVYAGNSAMMADIGISCAHAENAGTVIHVAVDGEYYGHITVSDEAKPNAKKAIEELKKIGISNTVMLTGDNALAALEIGKCLGITEIKAELLPQDKVASVCGIIEKAKGNVAFVGDGINDAPVIARADVGIAMGAIGADAAIEAADVVLMDDDPAKIPLAVKIAKRTKRIVVENIVFALGIKCAVLALCAFGLVGMWVAAFADVGVSVIAILNAMRAIRS